MAPTAVVPHTRSNDLQAEVDDLVSHARNLIDAARAESTRAAYASDWTDFEAFCDRLDLTPLPADAATVALYVADMSASRDLAVSTIGRRMAAIAVTHSEANAVSPTVHPQVRKLMTGLRRTKGVEQNGKRALTVNELRRMIATLGDDPTSLRDKALLLVGFVGGLRRSELVAINVGDLRLDDRGYALTIRRSKTDPEGEGRQVALPYSADPLLCPVRALQAWLETGAIERGAVFRRVRRGGNTTTQRLSAQSVGLVVKKLAGAAALTRPDELGGHSLRAGFATTAAAAGASERAIANQTGHRSMQVLRRYIRQATTFDDNAATELGL